jgi:hypothetical protein
MERCPGQDPRYLKPEDVYEVACPSCGAKVEFFKDDWSQKCGKCGTRFRNPKHDEGCAKWCPYSDECIDRVESDDAVDGDNRRPGA